MWFLAGDIGGTNTRLLACQCDDVHLEKTVSQYYASQDYACFSDVLRIFCDELKLDQIKAACFAVAGPVSQGVAKITNLPWQIDSHEIMAALDTKQVSLINDFAGVAQGIEVLAEDAFEVIQPAVASQGSRVVLGARTGLGVAIISAQGEIIHSEGGHSGFAPTDTEEHALLDYWQAKLPRVSNETFLSGEGIKRIYEFYRERLPQQVDPSIPLEAKAINEQAKTYKQPVALKTLQRFAAIYASVAADLALITRASGGVYLAGGIAPTILPFLQSDAFVQAFNHKPPMQALLAKIPVKVILDTQVGLLGALNYARKRHDHII